MKATQSITQIADQLGRHKSSISRELGRNEGDRGHCHKHALELALVRSQGFIKFIEDVLLSLQWCPKQIPGKLPVSLEMFYLHVYVDKANRGKLWNNLRYQKQMIKHYSGCQDRRVQIPNPRPVSERTGYIEDLKYVGRALVGFTI